MPTAFPISDYTSKSLGKLSVFRLEAAARSSPVDLNLPALSDESGSNLSDRLRFWHTLGGRSPIPIVRLTIRKLDLDEQALVHCHLEADGTLTILSNSKEYALRFFRCVFVNSPPAFGSSRDWKVKSGWIKNKRAVAFFGGSAAGALGWGPRVPREVEDSMKEAFRSIEKRNWKSCVVMCRRGLQALMDVAYHRFFGAKPAKSLDLNAIVRKFEALNPLPIPKHWLNIADAVRNIGNVPGAHPRAIAGYKFSKSDAVLAYSNMSSFISAYFEKIAP
jgi:hypothetical protein